MRNRRRKKLFLGVVKDRPAPEPRRPKIYRLRLFYPNLSVFRFLPGIVEVNTCLDNYYEHADIFDKKINGFVFERL